MKELTLLLQALNDGSSWQERVFHSTFTQPDKKGEQQRLKILARIHRYRELGTKLIHQGALPALKGVKHVSQTKAKPRRAKGPGGPAKADHTGGS
jgi:hypothetical protein